MQRVKNIIWVLSRMYHGIQRWFYEARELLYHEFEEACPVFVEHHKKEVSGALTFAGQADLCCVACSMGQMPLSGSRGGLECSPVLASHVMTIAVRCGTLIWQMAWPPASS